MVWITRPDGHRQWVSGWPSVDQSSVAYDPDGSRRIIGRYGDAIQAGPSYRLKVQRMVKLAQVLRAQYRRQEAQRKAEARRRLRDKYFRYKPKM